MSPRQSEPPPNADLTNDTDLAHNDHTITRFSACDFLRSNIDGPIFAFAMPERSMLKRDQQYRVLLSSSRHVWPTRPQHLATWQARPLHPAHIKYAIADVLALFLHDTASYTPTSTRTSTSTPPR